MLRRRLGQVLFGAAAAWPGTLALADPGLGRVEIGALAPDVTLLGMDGRPHALSDHRGQWVVLEWTSPVCPYTAIKYRHGYMQAIQRRAAARGVVWLCVNTSSPAKPGYLTPDAARGRLAAMKATVSGFLFDDQGRAGRAFGVRVTPTVLLVGKDGRLAYQGGLDQDPERSRDNGADTLTLALAELAAGRPVATPETRPYGCGLEYP